MQSISGVTAVNPLVAFYDIHGRKQEMLFFSPRHHTGPLFKQFIVVTDDGIIQSEKIPILPSELEDGVLDETMDMSPVLDSSHMSDDMSSRIVGGRETTIEEHPHQVSFIVNNSYFCGGFIISENYILTAGHCAQK
jgi:hypothetical protein